jgi:branched-chain amino acid transport system substrate-binding protein
VAAGCAGQPAVPDRAPLGRTVKVAVLDTFSGPTASAGRFDQNGLQVMADQLNAGGGLLGNRVEIVSADDERKPEKAAELAREQLSDSGVKLLVGPSSTEAFQAVKDQLGPAGVPDCVAAASDAAITGTALSFRVAPAERDRTATLLGYLQKNRPEIKSLALLDEGDATGQSYDNQVAQQAARIGLNYAGHRTLDVDADIKGVLQRLLDEGVQGFLLAGRADTAVRVATAAQELGLGGKVPLLGLQGLDGYEVPSAAGEVAAGSIFSADIHSYLTDEPEAGWPARYRTFVHDVTRQYGYGNGGVELQGTPAAADCLLQWARAVRMAGTFGGPAVARAWERLDLPAGETVLGVREKLSPEDHTAVAAQGVFLYSWVKSGSGYRLKQLQGPAAH